MSLKDSGTTFGENTDWLKPHWWFYIDSAEGITSNDVKDRGTYLKIKIVTLGALCSTYLLVGFGTVCSWSKMLFIEKSNVDQHLHLYTILLGDFHFHVLAIVGFTRYHGFTQQINIVCFKRALIWRLRGPFHGHWNWQGKLKWLSLKIEYCSSPKSISLTSFKQSDQMRCGGNMWQRIWPVVMIP